MISNIEDYFIKGCGRCERFDTPDCSTRVRAGGLLELREVCLGAELEEAVKWGHPCYMHAERNIAIIGATRKDYRLSFFDAALMKDPDGLLEKQGPNTEFADMIRFTSNDQVQELRGVIHSYLEEAKSYAAAGIRPVKKQVELVLPIELQEALAADSELAVAFEKLTPGRKKSYVINLNSAKKSTTRIARIMKFREKIIAGKGALER